MRKELLAPLAAGLIAVLAGIAGVLYMQRGAHIEVRGQILKVRTHAADENSTVMVIDFRAANPADYAFVVRDVSVYIVDEQGRRGEGMVVSEADAKRLFELVPTLGQKFNETLLPKDKIPPKQTLDRMAAVRFELPERVVNARKKLVVRIEDVDGPVSELEQ